jgi:hypothetical protein
VVSEFELLVSEESEEFELVLASGERLTEPLDSLVLLLVFLVSHDLLVSEFVVGADEFDIEPLLSAGAEAAVPEPLEAGLFVSWAKPGMANAIAATSVEALTMKPSRDFMMKSSCPST